MSLQVYPTLPGLTLPLLRMAEFDTLVQQGTNKYDVRLPQTVNPMWSWQLIYDFVRDFAYGPFFTVTELRTLLDFFLYQGGQAGDFLFQDPDDNSVGPAIFNYSVIQSNGVTVAQLNNLSFQSNGTLVAIDGGVTPNTPMAQLQIVTDGAGNYYSPLQRTLGGLFYEDITDLNTSSTGQALVVYANGVLKASGTDYTLMGPGLAVPGASYMGMYLKWAAAPTGPITAQFSFYFRVHFETDSQDMEKFANQFWTIGGSESQKGSGQIKLMQSRPNPL